MTSAGTERLRNRCVLRHGLHHLHSSYELQKMLVFFTHVEGSTIRPASGTEGWVFLDAKLTRLSLFDPSGTCASVVCVYIKCSLQNLDPFCRLTTELPFRPSDYRGCSSEPRLLSLFLSSFPPFFLILTSFYLIIIRVNDYCCIWSLPLTHSLGRSPLDKGSARSRDLYLTTHNTHNRQTPMLSVGFERAIPTSKRPQIHALDRASTVIGLFFVLRH
jgi:hypothetical protein